MLSTSVIKNVSEASHYFSAKDNYYTREEGMEQSEWFGRGADKLDLSGEVNAEQFTALLEGRLPNGELLGKVVDGKIRHRAGWDLTFSAPKSVSILALIGGDKRLIEAHRQAVKVALSNIEQGCSQARIKVSGDIKYQNTGNVVAALYHHDLSRAEDPQIHTHSVFMNMTQRSDGKWRSQASQIGRYDQKAIAEVNGFIERVRHNKRYFGKLYEAELAYQTKELGYDIAIDAKTGVFEIVGVSAEVKKFFSKRRDQIEKALEAQGLSSAKAADMITLKTRESKKGVDRDSLAEEWKHQAESLGLDCQKIIDQSIHKTKFGSIQSSNEQRPESRAIGAIQYATRHLSRFKTSFTLEEVVMSALSYSLNEPLPVKALLQSLDVACKLGELIPLENSRGKTLFMAKNTLEDEKRLFECLANKSIKSTLVDDKRLNLFFEENSHISSTHQDHLKSIFGNDRVILLEGQTAKETLIEPIVKIAKAANLEVIVLSQNQIGSKHFANQITQKPSTFWEHIKALLVDSTIKNYGVFQFLSQQNADNTAKSTIPDLIIVDNAHLLSTQQKADIVEWNVQHETKLVLLGNQKTLLPQQTGSSIEQIATQGVKTISLTNNKQAALALTNQKLIANALHKASGNIVDVVDSQDRLQAMAIHYSKIATDERRQSWLTAHQKNSVETLNQLTHLELKKNAELGKVIHTKVLIPVFIPEGKSSHARSYLKDQVVRFNEDYPSLSISRGEYLHVLHHRKDKNHVLLEKANGKKVLWHPDKVAGTKSGNVEAFNEKNREMGIGESIIFQRSVKYAHIAKGERFTIADIHNKAIKLKNQAGKSIYIDLNKEHHRHFDYGYAATLHAIAHEKPHTLIAELPTRSFGTNQRQFYQVVSQPNHAHIYTDDLKGFAKHIENKTGNKLSAHEVIEKSEEAKKNIHALYNILENQIMLCAEKSRYPALTRPAVEAIDYAIHHLAERDAGFTHKQIIETAMSHALGNVRLDDLNRAVMVVEKAGILLRGTRNDGTLWTTIDAVKMEREIIVLCQKDKGTLQPIANDAILEKHCDPTKLKPEQIDAVKAITQSKDRIIAIQGYAGTGKTTLLATVADVLASKELLNGDGYAILGLAPTNKAVSALKERGLPAQTLDSFILECQRNREKGVLRDNKLLLVIDEASMLSNRRALEILAITHEINSRAVLVGDVRQLPSVESGKPFNLIQKHVDTKFLVDIQRQQDVTLKQAVRETINYDFKAAFQTLKNSIIEINESTYPASNPIDKNDWKAKGEVFRDKRLNILVSDYFSFPKEERSTIQIITPGHDDRILVNEKIREQLKISGDLQKNSDTSLQILSAESFTQIERSQVSNFEVGSVLRFGKSEAVGIKAGEYLAIVASEQNHSLLTLKNQEGRELLWQVPKFDKTRLSYIEVFKTETRALQAGDTIRWSRSDKAKELFSTEMAHVISAEKNKVTVALANQKSFTFNPEDPKYQHWDHGYASTVYAVQADTKNIVLAHLESHRKNLTSQPAFLVALTREVNIFRLYTDNAEALLKTIEKNHGVKLSSLEVIGEYTAPESRLLQAKSIANKQQTQSDKNSHSINGNIAPRFNRDTVNRIKEGLNKNAEQIATEFLGTPVERGGSYLKFGSKQGSLSVTIKGEKQGWFNDFETNKGGRDMLKFVQLYGGMNRQESVQYAARWLGIIPDSKNNAASKINTPVHSEKKNSISGKQEQSFSDYEKRRIKFANQLAHESLPIKGTLAEKYLKEHRGIDTKSLSDDLRFHPKIYSKQNQQSLPALLSLARNKDGRVQSVEAIFLDKNTGDKANVPLKKQTIGPKKGAAVKINQTKDKAAPTLVAEGIVTGLSLANALPKTNVVVVLGKQMFSSVDPSVLSEKVIFCLDNDGKNLKTDAVILAAANRLKAHQKKINFIVPNALKTVKQDYNDILKQKGKEAIQRDFSHAMTYDDFFKNDGAIAKKIDPLPSQKTLNKALKNESGALPKIAREAHRPLIISDKQIAQISKEVHQESLQINKAMMTSYREISQVTKQNEPPKSIAPTRDIEREI